MNYCLNFIHNKENIMNNVEELYIKYRASDATLEEFIELHKNQQIIISIDTVDSNDIERFVKIQKDNIHIAFLNYSIENMIQFNYLKKNNVKCFFQDKIFDWETLNAFIKLGVSYVYISERLGFELADVAELAHSNNIKIRVMPNVSQTRWVEQIPAINTFFIRPEDIDKYEGIIDTIEFFGPVEKQLIYYDIYHKDKYWYGKLKEIIIGLDSDIDSRCIISKFGEKRVNCKQKCLSTGVCSLCNNIEQLANVFIDNDIILAPKE